MKKYKTKFKHVVVDHAELSEKEIAKKYGCGNYIVSVKYNKKKKDNDSRKG